jgi:hypothetical protein
MADNVDKAAWGVFFIILFFAICVIGLFGWAFIELVTWVTSK